MQNSQIGDILHPEQIKQIIRKLIFFEPQQYASKLWFSQDQNLQKLNMQLHVNALMKSEQYILEECVTENKLKTLIYDLILSQTWKKKVIPLIRPNFAKLNSFKLYMSIYHEAVVCNLLEVMMFHRTAVQESGQYLIQLIDYCYRQMVRQVNNQIEKHKRSRKEQQSKKQKSAEEIQKQKVKQIVSRTPEQEMLQQQSDIQFSLCMMAISITRYITDYIRHLEIGIVHHIIVECNIFALLVPLIQSKPWLRVNSKGQREVFDNNHWVVLQKHQYGRLPKVQGQVWIMLYNLFMEPECRKKFQLTEQRKSTLLRLRKYMNQVLLDQIPTLSIMLRALEQLSLLNVPNQPISNPLIVQQVPELKTKIENRNWKELAIQYEQRLSHLDSKQDMKRLAELYSNSTIQGLIQGFKCGKCNKEAFKRCSKCKNIWYCSRECQVAHWKQHKLKCGQVKVQTQPKNNGINQLD